MFFYIETIFRDPNCQRSIKIAVEGKTHFLVVRHSAATSYPSIENLFNG